MAVFYLLAKCTFSSALTLPFLAQAFEFLKKQQWRNRMT